jgi:hypothetical protein
LAVTLASLAAFVACSSEEQALAPRCEGVMVAGHCQTACRTELCQPGHECFNNACSAPCTTTGECAANRYCVGVITESGATGSFCACLTAVVDGVCLDSVPACDDATCPPDWRCVADACRPPCTTHADCAAGKNCLHALLPDGTEGNFCGTPAFAQDGSIGQNSPCAGDGDCDVGRGWVCRGGSCRLPCTLHADCGELGACTGAGKDDTGQPLAWCEPDDKPKGPGQYGSSCTGGAQECDTAAGFTCFGAGPGDADAYCTKALCSDDSECAPGYECAKTITDRSPCDDACGFQGEPRAANCVPVSDIADDKEFSCGPLSLVRRLCLKREFCSTCETNADCLALPNQVCAKDMNGNKSCTEPCDPNVNACPWGNAATCGVWDQELGYATCAHRFGSCAGTGLGCEPCMDQNDCKANGSCVTNRFSGERFCVDLDPSCTGCQRPGLCSGGGCPDTPGGLTGICVEQPGTPLQHKCYGANSLTNVLNSQQLGCWPPS